MLSFNDDPRMVAPQCHSLKPVEIIHENGWFRLVNRGGYYTIEEKQPQTVILPIVDHHSIVVVRVKRPVIADNPLELPAGGANENETPVMAAARELKEETGIKIEQLNRFHLSTPIAISPVRHPVLPWIFEVHISQREFDGREPHDDEICSVECFPFKEIKEKIIQGEIYVSLPLAIISRFLFSEM